MKVYAGDRLVADRVAVADRFGPRLQGLMFRAAMRSGEGLLIRPCNSVHTCFMRFAIDVVYLREHGEVLRVDEAMEPWRLGAIVRGARQVLELPAGGAHGVRSGDRLTLVG